MITELKVAQNSQEWLEARKGKVTGSIADKLLTWGEHEAKQLNHADNSNHSFYTRRGHILEDEAIELYEAIHRGKVQRPGIIVNDKYPNASCSPDGIDGKWLLEIKAYAVKKHLSIVGIPSIPFKVMAQLQFNMLLCELHKARLVLYNPDIDDPVQSYREIVVGRNLKIQRNMERKLLG